MTGALPNFFGTTPTGLINPDVDTTKDALKNQAGIEIDNRVFRLIISLFINFA